MVTEGFLFPAGPAGNEELPVGTGGAAECGDTATVAPRAFVLTNSTFLAPPQAAGLVRSVARPLQIANASLVCNLVPSVLPEKVCKKRRWMRIGLYRGATESPRRRTLRPAHGNLSAKLNYSAACVETTLPSIAVATHGDGKTRCRGNNRPPTHSPVVHNSCVLL